MSLNGRRHLEESEWGIRDVFKGARKCRDLQHFAERGGTRCREPRGAEGALAWPWSVGAGRRGAQEEQAAPGSQGSGSGGSREQGEGSRGTAKPALLLAQTPWKKQQVSLEDKDASTRAAGAFRHPPRFLQGKITGPDAPQSPGAGLLHLQDTPLRTKHHGANSAQHPMARNAVSSAQPSLA